MGTIKLTELETKKVARELYNDGATIEIKAIGKRGAIINWKDTKKEFCTCLDFYKSINNVNGRDEIDFFLVEEE